MLLAWKSFAGCEPAGCVSEGTVTREVSTNKTLAPVLPELLATTGWAMQRSRD
jgi:hypothetical protein